MAANFKIIKEEPFKDQKDPKNIVDKVLVYVQLENGLLKTMAFKQRDYNVSNRERMIADYLAYIKK
jgi:hypothetical protein